MVNHISAPLSHASALTRKADARSSTVAIKDSAGTITDRITYRPYGG